MFSNLMKGDTVLAPLLYNGENFLVPSVVERETPKRLVIGGCQYKKCNGEKVGDYFSRLSLDTKKDQSEELREYKIRCRACHTVGYQEGVKSRLSLNAPLHILVAAYNTHQNLMSLIKASNKTKEK